MKILITGGAGYVGTVLSNKLHKEGHDITILDNLTYGNQGIIEDIKIINGDITNSLDVDMSTKNQNAVIHLAAISNDPTGNLDADFTYSTNIEGTKKLVDSSIKNGVKRFIYASSSSVLGIQEGENITEETTPNPLTPYSKSKLIAEKYVMALNSSDFVTVAIRPATICGVSPRQRFDLVANALTGSAFWDGKITLYGGQQRRPNITMADIVNIYIRMLTISSRDIGGEVFHAGWENGSILNIAEKVRSKFRMKYGKEIPIEIKESSDNRDYHITSKKIENLCHRYYSMETAIEELIDIMELGFIGHYKKDKYHNLKVLCK